MVRTRAKQGDALASSNLGVLYKTGSGVKQDYSLAATFSRQGAENNIPLAQYHLGQMYEQGLGVEQDQATAINWYKRAAAGGVEQAKMRLLRLGATPAAEGVWTVKLQI
jgi:uncharacterized protein